MLSPCTWRAILKDDPRNVRWQRCPEDRFQPALDKQFLLNDLTVVGSLANGGDVGPVDLVYVPPPRFAPTISNTAVLRVDDETSELFGIAVDISGTLVVVGAEGIQSSNEPDPGAAHLFDAASAEPPLNWTGKTDGLNDEFGRAVATSGGMAIVGARGDDEAGENAGSAFLFNTMANRFAHKLSADLSLEESLFGAAVGIDGDRAIVGAPGERGGAAYIFDTTNGQQLFRLVPDDDLFERAVGIEANRVVVGEDQKETVYVFRLDTPERLLPGDADQDQDFDQLDLIKVLISGKYLSGEVATWGEGDWNGPVGSVIGFPAAGDGVFDQLDIIAAQRAGIYSTGRYTARVPLDAQHLHVPEPSTIFMLLAALVCSSAVRHRGVRRHGRRPDRLRAAAQID